jgi:4-amino-4-deoxy-L-arabinose transferase-like glycosyltransferase
MWDQYNQRGAPPVMEDRERAPRMLTADRPSSTGLAAKLTPAILAALVLASFGVRMWLLHAAVTQGTFVPLDHDRYMRNAVLLAHNGDGWHWTIEAIRYRWDGRIYLLPPLYPVFLSLFARFLDAYQYWAIVGQIALNALSIVALYAIASTLHSRRAGLIAAFMYAFWIPNIWTWALFMQEQLYIPLLMFSFALLVRATARDASSLAFACAGAAFGLATLTRSLPIYYILPVAALYPLMAKDRPQRIRQTAALLGGFLLTTIPYSLWLSVQVGKFVFVENHGGISVHFYGGTRAEGIPHVGEIAGQLLEVFVSKPLGFAYTFLGYVLALFHVHGDRWLQTYYASSAEAAGRAKLIAHAGIDVPFAISVVLAPLGAVLARRRREAALLALWIVVVVGLSALSAFGGVRYRSPFEPQLIALASVVLAGAWHKPGRTALVTGALASAVAFSVVAAQLPRVARGKANYGTNGWSNTDLGRQSWAQGDLGVNVLPEAGLLRIRMYPLDPVSPERPMHFVIRVDGHALDERVASAPGPLEVQFLQRHPGLHYVEITATGEGQPARFGIEISRGY